MSEKLYFITTLTSPRAFKTLSADRCALDWLEWSKEPDAVWMVWSLPRYLRPVADRWAISCHQPPGRLCPHQRKGNTQNCPNAKETHKMLLMIRVALWPIQDGRWADHMCEKSYGYICKKKASIKPSEGAQEEANPGCKLVSDAISIKWWV